jgi:light-regulated signal transduction histidine kinase (bacteriophytochrome)
MLMGWNLFDNAWKFTSMTFAARIEFGVIQKELGNIYFVRDNRIGFDNDYADKIFEAFHRQHRYRVGYGHVDRSAPWRQYLDRR